MGVEAYLGEGGEALLYLYATSTRTGEHLIRSRHVAQGSEFL